MKRTSKFICLGVAGLATIGGGIVVPIVLLQQEKSKNTKVNTQSKENIQQAKIIYLYTKAEQDKLDVKEVLDLIKEKINKKIFVPYNHSFPNAKSFVINVIKEKVGKENLRQTKIHLDGYWDVKITKGLAESNEYRLDVEVQIHPDKKLLNSISFNYFQRNIVFSGTTNTTIKQKEQEIIKKVKQLLGAKYSNVQVTLGQTNLNKQIKTNSWGVEVIFTKGTFKTNWNFYVSKREHPDKVLLRSFITHNNTKIILAGTTTGKVIANNSKTIVTKIKTLMGANALQGITLNVDNNMVDKQIKENSWFTFMVTLSKGDYSQNVFFKVKRAAHPDKLTIVKFQDIINNFADKNILLPSYTKGSFADNKQTILNAIKTKLNIQDWEGVKLNIDSHSHNITSSQHSVPILISKGDYSNSIEWRVSREENRAEIESQLNEVKKKIIALHPNWRVIKVYAYGKDKTVSHNIKYIRAFHETYGVGQEMTRYGISYKVKQNNNVVRPLRYTKERQWSRYYTKYTAFTPFEVIISKKNYSQTISIFKAGLYNAKDTAKQLLQNIKHRLEHLKTKTIYIDTSQTDARINTHKTEILNKIKKLEGYDQIKFYGTTIEIENSNGEIPNEITIILKKDTQSIRFQPFSVQSLRNE